MKMSHPFSLPLLLSLSLLIYTASAFDIAQLLSQHPEFSSFSSYLTQTNLAAEINARQTITVLAVDNANIAPLSAKPLDLIKNILAVHVILDYFDAPKLQTMAGSSALVTTLFQATGLARGQQGFLNVTRISSGGIAFGSAMPGSPINSNLVKSVVSQPYNISILQVSSAIIPQGIDGSKTSSPPSVTPGATVTPPPPSSVTPATPPPVSSLVAPPTPPTNSISFPDPFAVPPTPPTRTIPFPDPFAVPPTPSASHIPSTAPPTPSASHIPSTAPPTPSSASVPSTAPPTPSRASVPSAAPPTPGRASVPSAAPPMPSSASVPSTAPPTSSKAAPVPSKAGGPALASTPSATPALTPIASAPGPALGPVSAPTMGGGAPTAEEPGTTTPAAVKPKSAGTTLDVGLAVVLTMVLSAFYLTSTI